LVQSTDPNPIAFGESLTINSNNSYSSIKSFLAAAGSLTTFFTNNTKAPTPLGIATSNVLINSTYNSQGSGGVNTGGGTFLQGSICDALLQGTINVFCQNGSPNAQGSVYLRTAVNAAIPSAVVGGFEAVVDPNPVSAPTISTTNLSTAATVSSATGITAGMLVASANVPVGTYIVSISGTNIVLSQAATATAAGTSAVFTSNLIIPNMVWSTGYLEADDSCQLTILSRQIG
jgi:hypothetical protein